MNTFEINKLCCDACKVNLITYTSAVSLTLGHSCVRFLTLKFYQKYTPFTPFLRFYFLYSFMIVSYLIDLQIEPTCKIVFLVDFKVKKLKHECHKVSGTEEVI